MITPILIAASAFIGSIILMYLGFTQLVSAGNKYQKNFTEKASASLTDMFIFIDPKKLYILNVCVLSGSFFLIWLISGVWVLALIVSIILSFLPKFILNRLKEARRNRFLLELPDTLTSLSTMMKAGSNLNMALETVVAETPGPIADEFGLLMRELRIGVDYNQALDNLKERMSIQELELVVAGMKISREIGGSLAEVLYRLADTLRRKLEMEGKIRALTAQGKAQGYVMTGLPILLALILMKIEPVAMSMLFTEIFGWVTCGVFFIFLAIGYKFIQKIVNIDV
ncbi:type II secretion system F family protein [Marinibactrum halimedae]|uniref:Membrane protein n=1 Tax=Marinibactrum halimedae TaxID=1444977 RepID=A0AA37WM03_9GAMM|nr:type II secretion system F family protein [Marinibactrum halimedae]MCD9460293.1 type II secretion system F family protein [Marinibactrum halimedae]GLS24381.1 membrane protein [Marinibactrum halimedae]